ncbi:hypothetical protein BGZ47_004060 [Haplosporangium gracile]|nr:hypothetical protein BGZ47_004060 [Haplosporangium gracile]
MQPATATFFSTVELVDLLSTFLDHKALARLSTTSSAIDYVCSPIIWRNVTFKGWQYNEHKEVHVERFKGLAGREHHVRTLDMDADSLVLYMNGTGEPIDPLSPTRPDWVPAPHPQSSFKAVCFSPMTRLTRLECDLQPTSSYESSRIPGVGKFDSSNMFPQLCWLLELNRSLICLSLTGLQYKTTLDMFLLARSIGSLSELKHLYVKFRDYGKHSFEEITNLFFCLPISLESLTLKTDLCTSVSLEETDSDHFAKSLTLRDGPLLRLKELELPIYKVTPQSEYGRILSHCPQINTLSFLPVHQESASMIKKITPLVKRYCRHIRNVKATRATLWWYDWNPFDILDGVNSTLESLQFDSFNPDYDEVSEDLALSSFQYHSVTLRDVRLTRCQWLSNEIMQSILTTCATLERLEITQRASRRELHSEMRDRVIARLPGLVAHKWVCTGLKHLELTIDWGQFKDPTPTHLPAYYLQHSSSAPLDQDQEQWNLLERLYGQIGSLVELEVLNLSAYINRMHINQYEPENYRHGIVCGGVFDMSFRSNDRFPLLLSLGVHGGRRGYLDWLSGLRNLKELRGSVHLGNPEVAMTLKQDELEWMVEHWPRLQVLELLPYQDEVPVHVGVGGYEHLNWLLRRKPGLDLRRNWRSHNMSWDGLWTQDELDTLLNTWQKD